MRLRYREGTWFAVPLRSGGFAVGLVARKGKRGAIFLGYYFGPVRDRVPTLEEVESLQPSEAAGIFRTGDLSFINGEWPHIGSSGSFVREQWPFPIFVFKQELTETAWAITYADDDPNRIVGQEAVRYETNLPSGGLYGAGAVEIVLTDALAETRRH